MRLSRLVALAVLSALGSTLSTSTLVLAAEPSFRVVTYNLHSGLGASFALRRSSAAVEKNLRDIAAVVAGATTADEPIDVIGLNEVDFGSRRSGWIDQAAFLAAELERRTGERYHVVRGETWSRRLPGLEVRFGNAALARWPVVRSANCLLDEGVACEAAADVAGLPSLRSTGFVDRWLREVRGVVKLTLDVAGHPVDVLVTHLDAFVQSEREAQAAHLLTRFVDPRRTTVLLGDMNAVPVTLTRPIFPNDRTAAILTGGTLVDSRMPVGLTPVGEPQDTATFPSIAPQWPLDWVLGSSDLAVQSVEAIGGAESDHLGLFVRYAWRPGGDAREVATLEALAPVAH